MSKVGESMRDVAAARVANQKAWALKQENEKSRILKQDKPVNEILSDLIVLSQSSPNNNSGMNLIKLAPIERPSGPRKLSKRSKTITVIKDNPRRPGSDAHKRYELYSTCNTVAEYLAAGGTSMDVYKDKKEGNIKVN